MKSESAHTTHASRHTHHQPRRVARDGCRRWLSCCLCPANKAQFELDHLALIFAQTIYHHQTKHHIDHGLSCSKYGVCCLKIQMAGGYTTYIHACFDVRSGYYVIGPDAYSYSSLNQLRLEVGTLLSYLPYREIYNLN